jgi:hypothetical protein
MTSQRTGNGESWISLRACSTKNVTLAKKRSAPNQKHHQAGFDHLAGHGILKAPIAGSVAHYEVSRVGQQHIVRRQEEMRQQSARSALVQGPDANNRQDRKSHKYS